MNQSLSRLRLITGIILLIIIVSGCSIANHSRMTPAGPASSFTPSPIVASPTNMLTATLTPASTPLPTETWEPTVTPTATNTPTATPSPMDQYTIEGLRTREYPGGTIQVRSILTYTNVFTRYYIDYPSDELTITGIMQIPRGEGPFPVIVLNHGYIAPMRYWSGADTWRAAGYLNERGYLTIAPDFRGWGQSDHAKNFFWTGQTIDTLNAVSSLSSIPQADPDRVGMWGHSMGGGATADVITIDPRIKAAVIYAPTSVDKAAVRRWRLVPAAHPAEVEFNLVKAYMKASMDSDFLYRASPINYFHFVTAPVQLHVGTDDSMTPPYWSEDIYNGLQAAGKKAEYFTYPGEGHALHGENWRLFMERVTEFFNQHVKE